MLNTTQQNNPRFDLSTLALDEGINPPVTLPTPIVPTAPISDAETPKLTQSPATPNRENHMTQIASFVFRDQERAMIASIAATASVLILLYVRPPLIQHHSLDAHGNTFVVGTISYQRLLVVLLSVFFAVLYADKWNV